MRNKYRFLLITGDKLRHRFAAAKLAENCELCGIVSEAKPPVVNQNELSAGEKKIIEQHFAERDAVEVELLGNHIGFPNAELKAVSSGELNNIGTFQWISKLKPDFVILYGSSIIKNSLLNFYENRIVNLHLGLSPYYRGSGTNFFPLVYQQPECVGATIHLASDKVDAGAILNQVRPQVNINDRAHELGTKSLIAALEVMPKTIELYAYGKLTPQKQNLSKGKVFKNRDFIAQKVETMWSNFEAGMVSDYLAVFEKRNANFPIKKLKTEEL